MRKPQWFSGYCELCRAFDREVLVAGTNFTVSGESIEVHVTVCKECAVDYWGVEQVARATNESQ